MNRSDAGLITTLAPNGSPLAASSTLAIDHRDLAARRSERWFAVLWIVLAGIAGTLVFEINAIGADDNAWHPTTSLWSATPAVHEGPFGDRIAAVGKSTATR